MKGLKFQGEHNPGPVTVLRMGEEEDGGDMRTQPPHRSLALGIPRERLRKVQKRPRDSDRGAELPTRKLASLGPASRRPRCGLGWSQ